VGSPALMHSSAWSTVVTSRPAACRSPTSAQPPAYASTHPVLPHRHSVRPVYEVGDRLGYVHIGENHRGYLGSGHLDLQGFFHALADIRYTGPITFESFSSAVVSATLSNDLAPPEARLILTEGNYLLMDEGAWPRVRATMAEVWYVDVPDQVRRDRLVARHVRFGKTPDAARECVDRSDEANAALVRALRSSADLVVSL
jgi:hypothetical protein